MKKLTLLLLTISAVAAVFILPPISQNPHYHNFANQAQYIGIPNFWNVVSNLAFLFVAAAGCHLHSSLTLHEPWKRRCFTVLLLGIALTAFGSAYYHWHPTDARLVWDRLPMTIVFMSVLAFTIGDRIDSRLGSKLLLPLLILGVTSVLYWRWTGDLRPYAVVQFYPLIAVPLVLLLFREGSMSLAAQWGMIGFYGLAKLAEMLDGSAIASLPGGAHAWKHVFAALGLWAYTRSMKG